MSLIMFYTLIIALFVATSLATPATANKRILGEDERGRKAAENPRAAFFKKIVDDSQYKHHKRHPSHPGTPLKVGIIGAGAAGLYAGVLLDSLGIDYDIHEASDRIGGRIFTYRFDEEAWESSDPTEPAYYDYYDVGAMRFPPMPYMDRIIGNKSWSLIPYINDRVSTRDQVVQIPYIFKTVDTFRLYNGIRAFNQEAPTANRFNADDGTLHANFAHMDPSEIFKQEVETMTAALSANFDDGFNQLMTLDSQSVRAFFQDQGYTDPEIDWLETINDATGHYDMYSMSQAVLEQWVFTGYNISQWTAINGGMDMLTKGMSLIVKNKPILNSQVTKIKRNGNGGLKLVVNDDSEYEYAHVISTVPLGALQVIDMTELDLAYPQKNAIRKLNYDPAAKIGMKFKTRWWEDLPTGTFQGGQSFTDLPIRRCVYPSYGINITDAPGSMIASYVWGQDSSRLGAYLNPHSSTTQAPLQPQGLDHLVNITLYDLALLHSVSIDFLTSQLEDFHVYDWYQSEYSNGAFAIFGPGQFSTVMPWLMTPAADGHLHWGGEGLSSGHAWIIGAVNSAWRTVMEILCTEGLEQKKREFVEMWGEIDEVDKGWYDWSPMG